VSGEHDETIVDDEVVEVGCVQSDQWDVVPNAAGRDPRVILRAGPSAQLSRSSQLAPSPGDAWVIGDDRASGDPNVEGPSPGVTPAAHHHPLGEFADCDECQPNPSAPDGSVYPEGCPILLQQGRDVSVDDDVGHVGSGQGGIASDPEVSEEGVELFVGLPDVVVDEVVRANRLGVLQPRQLVECR